MISFGTVKVVDICLIGPSSPLSRISLKRWIAGWNLIVDWLRMVQRAHWHCLTYSEMLPEEQVPCVQLAQTFVGFHLQCLHWASPEGRVFPPLGPSLSIRNGVCSEATGVTMWDEYWYQNLIRSRNTGLYTALTWGSSNNSSHRWVQSQLLESQGAHLDMHSLHHTP